MTLGSLFDGMGGWCISAVNSGVVPLWASEIDKNPAAVAHKHFPEVKQLGDITKIDVEKLEPVDIVCAGSPCQDLSVAGKRAGLEGERSGLFRTAIDIVHRLRERTGKPRFFVWENVPGAFSSNHGEDFRAVQRLSVENKGRHIPNSQCSNGNGRCNVPMVLGVGIEDSGAATTMDASYFKGTGSRGNKERTAIMQARVRRLTPIECERLQGLPDNYTAEGIDEDGNTVKMSDSARYKMIGNGMAQPCADYVIRRIVEVETNDESIR